MNLAEARQNLAGMESKLREVASQGPVDGNVDSYLKDLDEARSHVIAARKLLDTANTAQARVERRNEIEPKILALANDALMAVGAQVVDVFGSELSDCGIVGLHVQFPQAKDGDGITHPLAVALTVREPKRRGRGEASTTTEATIDHKAALGVASHITWADVVAAIVKSGYVTDDQADKARETVTRDAKFAQGVARTLVNRATKAGHGDEVRALIASLA